ncbi:MAG TPA: PDZ domain-containing protein [Planctomycetota bacterium]|nr:PDZ domain-containing protein [Planctomycetota bacterium]
MKQALLVALLVAATGCKSNLWKDVSERGPTASEEARRCDLCLGIVTRKDPPDTAIGVPIVRVLKESPAEKAGLAPGDEIRSVGGKITRTPNELVGALHALRTGAGDQPDPTCRPVDLVVARDGEERVVKTTFTTWGDQNRIARDRIEDRNTKSTLSIPLIIDYESRTLPAELYLAYKGFQLAEPALLYRDLDIVPLLGFFSLFRLERTQVRPAFRLQVATWPLVFTHISDEEGLKDLLAPGEDRLESY